MPGRSVTRPGRALIPPLAVVVSATLAVPMGRAWGEAVGSPASLLKKGKWAMGLSVGLIPEIKMQGDVKVTLYQVGHSRGYGLTDRLTLFGKLGGAYLEADDASIIRQGDTSNLHRFDASLVVGVGLKGKLWESRDKGWEWDGTLSYLDVRARHRTGNDAHWREWTMASSVAKSLGRVKPYLGIKYVVADMKFKVRGEKNALVQQGVYKPEHRVGLFVGTDVALGELENVVLNVETGYLDGAEVTTAIQYVF